MSVYLLVAIVKKRFASLYEMPQKLNLATFEKPSLNTLLSTVGADVRTLPIADIDQLDRNHTLSSKDIGD